MGGGGGRHVVATRPREAAYRRGDRRRRGPDMTGIEKLLLPGTRRHVS